mmetsp:Transcript_35519/g.78798  ORF Transcript_35519/g.78798 Transcript_35519/m.78798 type:complete len:563 (+) Transcript_35519:198-1886(+)
MCIEQSIAEERCTTDSRWGKSESHETTWSKNSSRQLFGLSPAIHFYKTLKNAFDNTVQVLATYLPQTLRQQLPKNQGQQLCLLSTQSHSTYEEMSSCRTVSAPIIVQRSPLSASASCVVFEADDEDDEDGYSLETSYSLPNFLELTHNTHKDASSPPCNYFALSTRRPCFTDVAASTRAVLHLQAALRQQPLVFVESPTYTSQCQFVRDSAASLDVQSAEDMEEVEEALCMLEGPPMLYLLPAPFLPEMVTIGHHCEQGCRNSMEDKAFAIDIRAEPHSNWSVHGMHGFTHAACFGVFDGHGGVDVAEHLTEELPKLIAAATRCGSIKQQGVQEVASIMLAVEEDMRMQLHPEWHAEGRDPGSTALVATIIDSTLLVANVGDCRLLLISEVVDSNGNRTAYVSRSTNDHTCRKNPHEHQRVKAAGAGVDPDGYVGAVTEDGYVEGKIEVSRSLGDFRTKTELGEGVIIPDPELYTWSVGPDTLFAVALSDGISSKMDDCSICNMVCTLLNDKKRLNDPTYAASELAKYAVASGSSDNCSAVVVVLKAQPPPMPARRKLFGNK